MRHHHVVVFHHHHWNGVFCIHLGGRDKHSFPCHARPAAARNMHGKARTRGNGGETRGHGRHATEEETKEEHGGRGRRTDGRTDVRTMKEGVCGCIRQRGTRWDKTKGQEGETMQQRNDHRERGRCVTMRGGAALDFAHLCKGTNEVCSMGQERPSWS